MPTVAPTASPPTTIIFTNTLADLLGEKTVTRSVMATYTHPPLASLSAVLNRATLRARQLVALLRREFDYLHQ